MSTTEQLLALAAQQAKTPDVDDETFWRSVTALHGRPERVVFDACAAWCVHSDAELRSLAADVLGQLGWEQDPRPFRSASMPPLLQLLSDPEPEVVASAVVALRHLGPCEVIDRLAGLAASPDPRIRRAVAFALGAQECDVAEKALVLLSRDEDAEVRDWATCGLGSGRETDNPRIREALFARVEDPDADTRAEALFGLVRRRDARVLAPLRKALESDEVVLFAVEAARDAGARELVPALEALREWWDDDPEMLEGAIERCSRDLGWSELTLGGDQA